MRIGLDALLMGRIPDGLFEPSEIISVQPKCDGIWFEICPDTLEGKTRDDYRYSLKEFTTPLLDPDIEELAGELVYLNPETGAVTRDRSKVMTVLQKHKNWEEHSKHIRMLVFSVKTKQLDPELSTWDDYRKKYIERIKHPFFLPMPTCYIEYQHLNSVITQYDNDPKYEKLEGVVIRRLNAAHITTYDTKEFTHPDMFKLKPVYDATLRCVACVPHKKKEGWIGSLILVTSDKQLKVPVGSGLDNKLRVKDKSFFIGKLFEIEFENISSTGNSLTHPRFPSDPIREDMIEADSFDKLKDRAKKFIL